MKKISVVLYLLAILSGCSTINQTHQQIHDERIQEINQVDHD